MAKPERMLTDAAAIEAILQRGSVCHLAMVDGDRPYVVPLCYGYRDGVLYAHSAREGRKLDILRRNPAVCFDVAIDTELAPGEGPCRWSMHYRSVIGTGRATLVDEPAAKRTALDIIMAHYGGQPNSEGRYPYAEGILENTIIIRIDIESLAGKENT
ncbi:MAG TPA: pyridoxamine 5'-phosphate oxidase family protein [Chloroflexi bacterium]|jgi:nitroimidazol reductase NimA-like FMN-containing flavoprotein (pyridoxamine 5'-phosphate oxidase superfamily)|nr:pyridoxamine 5'-phosphate oxidase family protein [Chloroflexota bacterium]